MPAPSPLPLRSGDVHEDASSDSEAEEHRTSRPKRSRGNADSMNSSDIESDDADEEQETVASLSCALSEALVHDVRQRTTSGAAVAEDDAGSSASQQRQTRACCVCATENVQYTCPACKQRACSLPCVRLHKTQHHCTGERNVSAPVPLSKFDDAQFHRDFHFLEDCRRVLETVQTHRPRESFHYSFHTLPPPLYALREAGKKRGVLIQLISEGLKKREENTTRYDKRSDTIIWRCEFRFISSVQELLDKKDRTEGVKHNFSVATNWGNERYLLGDILKHCVEVNPSLKLYHIRRGYSRASRWVHGGVELAERSKRDRDEAEDDAEEGVNGDNASGVVTVDDTFEKVNRALTTDEMLLQQRVQRFLSDNAEGGYSILTRAERLADRVLYFPMNSGATLHDNLRTVFFINEFPVFYVVRDEDMVHFELVSDADKETIRESFRKKERPTIEQRLAALPKKSELDAATAESYAKIPCRQFLRGGCARPAGECPYWHCTAAEVPACRNMVISGECPKGGRCSFSHDPDVVSTAKALQAAQHQGGGRGAAHGRVQRGGFHGGGRSAHHHQSSHQQQASNAVGIALPALLRPIHIPMPQAPTPPPAYNS